MRKNSTGTTKGRQPDVVDVKGGTSGYYETYATWLDEDKVTIRKTCVTKTRKGDDVTAQYTLTRRSGRMRFLYTSNGIAETSRPQAVFGILNMFPEATQSLISGHLFGTFLRHDKFVYRVQSEMWPMIIKPFRTLTGNLHPAFRRDTVHDFMYRLVGYNNIDMERALDWQLSQHSDKGIYALQSLPRPNFDYEYKQAAQLLYGNLDWQQPLRNVRRLPFEQAVEIISNGWPKKNAYGLDLLDLTGHGSLQSAINNTPLQTGGIITPPNLTTSTASGSFTTSNWRVATVIP